MNRALAVVDLGGTWVRVSVSGPALRAYRGPTPGVAGLPALLGRLWRRWRLTRRGVAALGVASRGVWTRGERRALARRLRRFAPRVVVISDVEAAYLGALGTGPGVLLLAGTGSIALGRDRRGRVAREGGLGPLLGDDGSAFAIGRAWLRGGALPWTRARGLAMAPDAVARVAALAPGVLRRARAGDATARRVVGEAQEALAALAAGPARALGLRPPITVSWAGGLLAGAAFRAGVWRRLRRRGLRVRPVRPRAAAAAPSAWRSLLLPTLSPEGKPVRRGGARPGRRSAR
ncbi:MAG TPA: BadF/BadG/BcrA/BcrD ATPase family protein [Methylomirabilota bacterium]|nr:BadF/BadG/BcrA/BcrD ATPase family protein [Methylomirabilota bacterium]